MPGTSHRIVDNEPLRERTVVVGALSADREHVSAAAHEQNRVLSDMADELGRRRAVRRRELPTPDQGRLVAPALQPFRPPGPFFARVRGRVRLQ